MLSGAGGYSPPFKSGQRGHPDPPSLPLQLPWDPSGALPPCFSLLFPRPDQDPNNKKGRPLNPKTREEGRPLTALDPGTWAWLPTRRVAMAVGWHTLVGSGFQAPGRPWASLWLGWAGLGCWHSLADRRSRTRCRASAASQGSLSPGYVHTTHLSHGHLLSWLRRHHRPQPGRQHSTVASAQAAPSATRTRAPLEGPFSDGGIWPDVKDAARRLPWYHPDWVLSARRLRLGPERRPVTSSTQAPPPPPPCPSPHPTGWAGGWASSRLPHRHGAGEILPPGPG